MEDNNKKYVTLCFVAFAIGTAFVTNVLIQTLARTFGFIAKYLSSDIVIHGIPVVVGVLTFALLQFNSKVVAWADEVVVEVRKVVFPSHKDTFAMTIVVTIMVLISGVLLGIFDFLSNVVVNYLVGM